MFASPVPIVVLGFFMLSSFLIGVPTGVKIFNWIATLWRGSIVMTTALWFAIGMIAVFTIGGITGIFLAIFPVDWQLNDTYFVVAHFHYTIIGGAVFPVFAGLYYWFPKMTGRLMNERIDKLSFWLMFIGFNTTFFVQHSLGLSGMPRRVYTYQPEMGWGDANLFVSLSAVILAAGFVLFFIDAIRSARHGAPAGDNPWDAGTLEWATASPPPCYNFLRIPVVTGADPLWDEREALLVAGGLCVARREIVITTVAEASPEAREASPRNSIWPFVTSLATTLMLISSIFSPWAVVWGSIPVAVALIGWFWPKGTPEDDA
jgi:cytochrome c oxidase subunit I+III